MYLAGVFVRRVEYYRGSVGQQVFFYHQRAKQESLCLHRRLVQPPAAGWEAFLRLCGWDLSAPQLRWGIRKCCDFGCNCRQRGRILWSIGRCRRDEREQGQLGQLLSVAPWPRLGWRKTHRGGQMQGYLGEVFPEAKYQRYTVHFYRNVFSVVPKSKVKLVAKMLKAIHAQESKKASREKAKAVVEQLCGLWNWRKLPRKLRTA